MSVEEDVELRDLVAQTLEKNGCLAKLRAELRASIFLALDEDIKLSKQQPLQNHQIQSYLETCEGRAMFCLVREFLEFFNLQFTISVYEPESYLNSMYPYEGRQKTAKDLGLDSIEEPTVPLLQQLLKIAQAKSKVLDINLNLNGTADSSFKDESLDNENSYKKTDTNSLHSKTSLKHNLKMENESNKGQKLVIEKNGNLNATFDLSSPTVNLNNIKRINLENEALNVLSRKIIKDTIKEDDTYEDTSSIAEDSEALVNADKSLQEETASDISVPIINPTDTLNGIETVASNKTDNKFKTEIEKPKLSPQRLEKLKTKTSLSSLSDLPPLLINKSRVNSDILPSLYSKEFKDKSNLKELDKMFDMEAEYEEDFMCSSNELSLNSEYLNSGQSKINLLDEAIINKIDSEKLNILNKKDIKVTNSDKSKSVLKSVIQKNVSVLSKHVENGSIRENSLSD